MQYIFQFDANGGEKPDARELMRLWGSFLLEIRKNVGNPKSQLTAVDMLRGQIKDIDTFMGTGWHNKRLNLPQTVRSTGRTHD